MRAGMRTAMRTRTALPAALAALMVLATAVPAVADHTNPRTELAPTSPSNTGEGTDRGEGTWEFIANFPPNPGTDLELFKKQGDIYSSSGTLGQANAGHVGQRLLRLTTNGEVAPEWVADHGSANCPTANPSGTTGLQHDVQIVRKKGVKLLIDTTDANGRCHDSGGGGLEIVDISKLHKEAFEPREIALTRHAGTSHNVTVDDKRPWVVYNSASAFTGMPWIDVLDIRSCLLPNKMSVEDKRKKCRPKVFRILLQPEWVRARKDGELVENTEGTCHDITSKGYRIYCAALNATVIIDTKGLTDPDTGAVKGTPLDCELVDGTNTGAKVTNCSSFTDGEVPQAKGFKFVGNVNHAGRDCGSGPGGTTNCNTNIMVRSDDDIAVAHEADPSNDDKYMFVTDERGGGIVPGGASCTPGEENPYGNGGVHMFDISDPDKIEYMMQPDDTKAVYITEPVVPSSTFCTAHVMEMLPGEQRFVISWYSQGTKIVDYYIDDNGKAVFNEVASLTLANTQQWAVEDFKIVNNEDGTRTYYFIASDIERGIDIFSWTGEPNPMGSKPPASVMARYI